MSPKQNPFGVLAFLPWNDDWNNHHFPPETLERAYDQLKELGIGSVRMDYLWHDVHRGPGRFDFSKYDRLTEGLLEHGIGVLGLLNYNRDHSTPAGEPLWNRPPDSFEEFAGYVNATVSHFRGRVSHWEVWNEPNHPYYWIGDQTGLRDYGRLLKLSYAAAKAADPGCVVLNGGVTDPLHAAVENLYSGAGAGSFDALSIHTFIDPLLPDAEARFHALIEGATRIMDRHGDTAKKIWITEMGCPGTPDAKPQKWFAGENVGEARQAEWLGTQFGFLDMHPRIEKMFWAFYRDTEEFNDGTDHLGLVRFDLSPKPSFERLKGIIRRHVDKRN